MYNNAIHAGVVLCNTSIYVDAYKCEQKKKEKYKQQ